MIKASNKKILQDVSSYYSEKVLQYGPCPRGVDWNGHESQLLRFQQLVKVISPSQYPVSVNDLGCGYGALVEFLIKNNIECSYYGYDISSEMISAAREKWGNLVGSGIAVSFQEGDSLSPADYTIASGIFNVKQDVADNQWQPYIIDVLHMMKENSTRGFSFNMLTSYSDLPYIKDYLYYADPCFFFDYCKRNFSRNVALLHDYGLYEFTLIVRL